MKMEWSKKLFRKILLFQLKKLLAVWKFVLNDVYLLYDNGKKALI